MKKLLLTCFVFALVYNISSAQCTLKVIIKNVEKAEGKIEVGLYNGSKYWLEDEGQYYDKIIDCTSAPTMTITIPNVEYGTYAFSLYHDENSNGKMDFRTWIPKEPYGFSNNPRAKWSKPSFKKCAFEVNQATQTIEVDLQDW